MVNGRELRIGNYLLLDDLLQSVSEIRMYETDAEAKSLIGFLVGDNVQYAPLQDDCVQGVPITDEALERCGFQFDSYFKLWQRMKDVHGTGVDMELDRDYTVLDFAHRAVLKEIKHLHHLQNLYFALKRKELPIDMIIYQNIASNKQ